MLKTTIIVMLSVLGMMGCQNQNAETPAPKEEGKTLVVYYSYTHNTEEIVTDLCRLIQADVLEIEPAVKGLDYAANNYAIGTEQLTKINDHPNDAASYPAIDPVEVDLNPYTTIIVATPLWWSQMASYMQTFLFQYGPQMEGKTIGLIVSSYSSGISGVERDIKRLIPTGKFLSKSLWINNSKHAKRQSYIENWLKETGLSDASKK